ncbi:MAG: hypothetical protein ABH823_04645 [bacterium]
MIKLRMPNAELMSNYLNTWGMIIVRPILFFTKLKEENWQKQALTFFLFSSWLLALVATVVVFVIQYVPIGRTLVEGLSGLRFVLILPVLLTLIFVFFMITFLIIGGLFTVAFFAMLYSVAWLMHYTYLLLGGKGSFNRLCQSVFYSSAVLLDGVLILALIVLTKYGNLSYSLFRVGFNFTCFLILVFIYGLWAIAGRKTYKVAKWQAFLGALAPILLLLIFGLLFDKIGLPHLRPWIS